MTTDTPPTPEPAAGAHPWLPAWRKTLAVWWLLAGIAAGDKLLRVRLGGAEEAAQFTWWGVIAYQLIVYTLWWLVSPLIFRLARRVAEERSWRRRLKWAAAGAAAAASLFGLIRPFIHQIEHTPETMHELSWLLLDVTETLHANLTVFIAVFAAGLAARYYDQREAQRATAAQIQARLAEAQLRALQMQLNPHFLFNALNTVSALVERDPATTRRVVARLSELLRRSLDAAERGEVSLGEELAFVRGYFEIMRARFGERLSVDEEIDEALLGVRVPAFLLQPVVENAFEHGVARARGRGVVALRVSREGERLLIRVRDNGPGPGAGGERAGIGLANTRARLAQLYPRGASLQLSSDEAGTLAEIALPCPPAPGAA
jgi:sensor histidine kinase YesM